jgi:chromosome segregation ATPase
MKSMAHQKANQYSILIVVGMHRSGTSLATSLLQGAGLHIGRRLIPPDQGNIKGYFENLDFHGFHQEVLKSQGVSEDGWTLQEHIEVDDRFIDRAKQVVERSAVSRTWGWKDPRTTLFLDFWAQQLPQGKFLLIYRSPWEVVDSLYRRGTDQVLREQPELAVKMWLHYNRKMLNFYNQATDRCFLVNIDTLLSDFTACVEALNQRFALDLTVTAATKYDAGLFTRLDPNGHRASLVTHYFPEAVEMYRELEARSWQNGGEVDLSWFEQLQSAPYRYWAFQDWNSINQLRRNKQELAAQLQESDTEKQQLSAELGETRQQRDRYQTQLSQKTEELEKTQSQLHQTQEELGQTQSQLEERQTQLYQTEAILSQHQSHLQQVETLLEQSQTQLSQKTEELGQTQSQLHQTEELLKQSQAQLHDTEEVLEKSVTQLQQKTQELQQSQSQVSKLQEELGQTQSQQQQTEEKLGQTQSQLHQTEEVLEQSQAQLHETEAVLEQSMTQLQQKTQELQQSQSQVSKLQEELGQTQSQQQQIKQEEQQAKSELAQTRSKLEEAQTQLYQTEAMLTEYQSHLQQTESALERSQSQLHYIQERTNYQKAIAGNSDGNTQTQYKLLIWDGWYAYLQGDLVRMSECLQQSLKYTSLSRTETISNWLETFGGFASPQNGSQFDIHKLINSMEWQQLMRRVTTAKVLMAIK